MHQKTRYNIRLAQRRQVGIRRAVVDQQAIDDFYLLLQDTSERNAFEVHTRAYYEDFLEIFGDQACLLFADVDGQIAAGLIAVAFGDEAIYMYGGSSTEHRAHGAAFLLQYEAMKWARDQGCKRYDLWGIPALDPESTEASQGRVAGTQGDDWRGLYIFKTRFGGEIVSYPGAFERQYHPILAAAARRVASIGG